ncbi:hypothetical protein NE637_05170 [Desulfovibrio desulfuricans]|uniref:hypothetical protein n=1 Tax=Desulfovibrio desulfuricans TaxID=876 RepID=UPI002109327D|nr:hypothetical protein [Desulfovibrio desulfuricans]MCQ4860542.1 hypothetical protein [Desulfovibrio desulfuricans]
MWPCARQKTALAGAERNNPDNFAAIKMLIGSEPSKIDERTGFVVFLWKRKKWDDEFAEVAFVKAFMDSLPSDDFLFIRLGEDYDDIETRGNFRGKPFGMYVERKIVVA